MSREMVLVTGGAGFIGSNLVEELLMCGYYVRVLDNFSTGKRENIIEFINDIDILEGDVRSYHIVAEAVKGVNIIFHEAALPSVPRSIRDPITSNDVNVTGTLNVLNAARQYKVKRIIFASSSSVYGNSDELPKNEGMIPNPLSPYAVSKLAGEKYCNVFSKLYGIETICLRYFNVFGPKQDPASEYSAVIPKFIKLIKDDQSPVIYGDGLQSRDFTFVKNVVEANIKAGTIQGTFHGEVFNIACGKRVSLRELVLDIGKLLSKEMRVKFENPRCGDVKHSLACIKKAQQLLSYEPVFNFDEGLEKTIDYFLDKYENKFQQVELII